MHSALSLGQAGGGAWQAALQPGPGPLDPVLMFPFQPLEGCKVSLLCRGKISALDSDPCNKEMVVSGEVFPGLHLASLVVAGFGSHRGLCVNILVSLLTLQGHSGHACSEIYLCL